jgi:hypothetical protein
VKALQKLAASEYAKKFAAFIQKEKIPTFIAFLLPIETLAAFDK